MVELQYCNGINGAEGMDQKTIDDIVRSFQDLPDEQLAHYAVVAWQSNVGTESEKDEDGFPTGANGEVEPRREELQQICWKKFHRNPQVNTSVRGQVGRLTGRGFETSSDVPQIQKVIEDTELDWRNRLYNFMPKYVGRGFIEGELFLVLTCDPSGFIEVDFLDPSRIQGGKTDGVIYHPRKTSMPLAYMVKYDSDLDGYDEDEIIPSIFIAKYPSLLDLAKQVEPNFNINLVQKSKNKKAFKKFNGYYRFVVAWDKSFLSHRNVSYLRTIIEWLNHYENLKKYEIDHKKSAGAYLWVVEMTDIKTFKLWLSLSEEDKKKTGIMAKKTPGGTLVLPPGMKLTAVNPNLPKISESDTDILHMVTSGLNEPEDVSTGQAKGTFASVKASRGPMSDRISDEIAYFDRFLKYDFWGSIFFLKSQIAGTDFPETFKVRRAIGFKGKKPIMQEVERRPELLIEISYPTSEMLDNESRAKAFLGVKHGSLNDTLGIPNSKIANELGIGNYHKQRLEYETEKEKYPDLIPTMDAESMQEQGIEPARPRKGQKERKPKPQSEE